MKLLPSLRWLVLALVAAGVCCSASRAGLVAYYNFDDVSSPWADSSGNGNDAVSDAAHPAPVLTTSAALGGGAVDFTDSSATQADWLQNLQLPDIRSLFTGNAATISMWVKLVNATPGNGNQTGLFSATSTNAYATHYPWTDGIMYCGELRDGNNRVNSIALTSQDRSQWHHLTIVADASPIPGEQIYKVFQNAAPVVDRTTDTFNLNVRQNICLGVGYGSGGIGGWYSLNGYMDDVGIFNEALSDGKVLAIYNAPQTPGLSDYDLGRISQLFGVYDSADPGATASIGILTWSKATGLIGHSAGDAWADGQRWYVQLDSRGNGVIGAAPNLRTWTGAGGDNHWSTGANWEAGTPPANGDSLVFAGSNRTVNTNDDRLSSVANIAFANGDFTLGGSDLGISGGITNTAGNNTVGVNLSLQADQKFLCVAGTLIVSGNINNGSSQLTIDGAGDTSLGGVLGSGAGRLVKSGMGTLTLSAANTYQGGMLLNAGTLKIGADAALGAVSGSLVFGGSATLQTDAALLTLDAARSVSIAAGTATFDTQANTISVPGPISGAGSLAKIGPGALNLTGASTFNGELRVKEGAVDLGATGSIQNNAPIWIADTPGTAAALRLSGGSISTSQNVYLGYNGSTGEIMQTGGAVTLTNPPNSLRIGEGAGASGTYNISGGSLTINCPAGGDATIWIGLLGQGTMNISGDAAVTVTGGAGAALSARGIVVGMGGAGAVNQTGGAVTLNNAPLVLGRYWTSTTASGQYAISAGSLTTQGSIDVNAYVGMETGTFGTLEVSGESTSVAIQGATHVGYSGTGTLTISGGAYTTAATSVATLAGSSGALNLNGGTYTTTGLSAGQGAALVAFDGGTLKAAATFTSQVPMTFNPGGAKIDTNDQTVVLAGNLSGPGGLKKQGNGVLVLAGNNSFAGALDVQAGLLKLVDPAPLPPAVVTAANASLRLWLDANDPATVQVPLGDGKISQWDDKSSYANHASQSDPSRQGTYQLAALNGRNIVDLGYPGQPTALMLNLTSEISDIQSVFLVLKGGGPMLGHTDTGNTVGYEFHRGGPNWGAAANDAIWAPLWASPNIQNGQTHLNGILVNGATTALPTAFSLIDVQTTGSVSANQIGEDRNLENRSGQQIAEIIVFNSALSDADRQAMEYYLGNKWLLSAVNNLPAGTPVHLAAGATLDLSNQSVAIGPLSGEGDVLLGSGTLATSNTDPAVFAGSISGAGSLVKAGPGTLALSGTNVHAGGTTVQEGTLEIGAAGALPAGGSLSIGAEGTASLAGGPAAAASPAPVPEPGTLALLAAVALSLPAMLWRKRACLSRMTSLVR